MADFTEFYYKSANGKSDLRAKKIVPAKPKAIVQIAHGIAEHIDRYDDFASFLAENGYAVYANDHLGHGKSISGPSDKGVFAEKDGWNTVVKDMVSLHDIAVKENPGIPFVIFGHSMGSFLARTYMIDYQDKYDAAIISGTGHQSPLLVFGGNFLSGLFKTFKGYRSSGDAMANVAFGAYLDKIKDPISKNAWISSVDEVVKKYDADPLCGFTASAGLYGDMMKGIKYITNMSNICRMNPDKPVYFMSGKEDPVGDYGKGVEKAYECFKKAGLKDVMMRLYEGGRHEMLNEANNAQVYQDILAWLNEKVG